jgi:hypothetical protein
MKQQPPLRKLLIILVGIVVLGIVWMLIVTISRTGKTPIVIIPSPIDAKITIDGKPAKSGTVYVSKGAHAIKATRTDFVDTSKNINTKDLEQDNEVYVILEASNDAGRKYIQDHPEEGSVRGRVGGREFDETVDKNFAQYPVLKQLPIDNIDYRVDYAVDEKKNVVFEITLLPTGVQPGTALYTKQLQDYKGAALAWLKNNGVDITKATISVTPDPDKQP